MGRPKEKGGRGGKKPNFKSEGRHRCQAKVSIQWRSGPDMAGRLQLHLLLPDTERRWRRRRGGEIRYARSIMMTPSLAARKTP